MIGRSLSSHAWTAYETPHLDPAHEGDVCLPRLERMIFEILVWLSVYALHHMPELRIISLVCGGVFLIEHLNAPSNKLRPPSTRQALCQALRVARDAEFAVRCGGVRDRQCRFACW